MLLLLGIVMTANAQALTLEGVTLPEEVRVGDRALVLNGAGVREKFFIDIYIAGLYLPERQSSAQKILGKDQDWRMIMHFVYSEVESRKLADGWQEGFEANLDASQLKALQPRLDRFKSLFPTLRKGEELVLEHRAGNGVEVIVQGEEKGVIEGTDFAQALLSVWLGPEPVTGKLKRDLLGGR